MALKWGIAAAGRISDEFTNALSTLDKQNHKVVAIGARDLSRAEEFAKRHNIPKAHGSYIELAKDANVEVVYIGVMNPQHFEVAMLMLEHGKHVLCEKPLCINEKLSKKLIAFAESKKLFLMEGIWSRLFPSYQYIREQINGGKLGEILSVEAEMGFGRLKEKDRLVKKDLGGGTILDLGIYTIQLCQWVFQQEPQSIKATGKLNEDGVDVEMTAEINYGGNKVAKIKTSALDNLSNVAKIIGKTGEITIPTFWCPPTLIDVDKSERTWPLPKGKYDFKSTNGAGLSYEADEVRKCIQAGKLESDHVSHNESLIIARIEDEIRKQIGVTYPEDD